ncbi:MAG: tripartite tricarboxylate transporter TctB family protein [Alphaproteobacteria bacterium]|nr:tripartite tricarboxylate transporter TctB family protein [Alphaproteobacteria bacterium]MCB9930649.1 tripartite tricarboxylate transporter TctB family protein [Alphaproteobacteria bacterium]
MTAPSRHPPDLPSAETPARGVGWGDYGVPVVVFAFCGLVTHFSLQMEEALPIIIGHSMQPRVFPIFLMGVIAVLNLGLIAQILMSPVSRRDWEPYQTWATAVLLGVFYLLAVEVDLILAMAAVMFALSLLWGQRRWWVAALTALLTTGVIFFTFDLLLEVRFPRGLFTDWYYG